MYTIILEKSVQKMLKKHQWEPLIKKFKNALRILENDPNSSELDIKWLAGLPSWNYRLRIGKYRFLYEIIDHKLIISFYDAWSRGEIYKNI